MTQAYRRWAGRIGRAGYAARAVVYGLVAAVALDAARRFDPREPRGIVGALRAVAERPGGRLLLALLTVGILAQVLWRGVQALTGIERPHGRPPRWWTRIGWSLVGVFYAALLVRAVGLLWQPHTSGHGHKRSLVARGLSLPFGRAVAFGIGIGLLVFAFVELWHAWRASFLDDFDPRALTRTRRRALALVGRVGVAGRAFVFGAAGVLLVRSTWRARARTPSASATCCASSWPAPPARRWSPSSPSACSPTPRSWSPRPRGAATCARPGYDSRTRSAVATVLLAVAVVAWAAHRALFPLSETDLFFHLKLGDLIVATRHIPFRNLFSFTYPDHPDADLAWAFQVLMSLTYRAGGFGAIVVVKTLLVAAAVALSWIACRRRGLGALPTALALVIAVEAARPRLVERPHLVTFVGIAALNAILAAVEARPRRWWWIPALTLVWAQFHAGVFFCALTLFTFAVGAALDRATLPWRRVAAAGALSVAAMFATPAGTMLPRYLLWHTGLGATRIIDEFRHADAWNDPWFFVLVAVCLATAVARRPRRWRELLPIAITAWLASRSVRFVAEFAILSAPLVADGFDRLLRAHAPRRAATRVAAVAAAASLFVVIAAERAVDPAPPRLAADVVPFDAIDFVTSTGLRHRMFHDLDVGCYLAWEGWPRWQVFEDARLPAYPDEFHRAMDATPNDPRAFDALLRRWDVDAALLVEPGTNRRSGSFDPDEWALVWRRPSALVFARRTPAHAAVIAASEIPLRMSFRWEDGMHTTPLFDPPARSPMSRCEWDRRLATLLDADGDPERALDARADALAHDCLLPAEEADARFYLAARLQRHGELARAAAEYDRVLALRPDDARARINRAWAILPSEIARSLRDISSRVNPRVLEGAIR